jgi:histone H3/H4
MKADDNIKLVQKDVYNLLGKATELFLQELANNTLQVTSLNKRKTMNIEDIGNFLN